MFGLFLEGLHTKNEFSTLENRFPLEFISFHIIILNIEFITNFLSEKLCFTNQYYVDYDVSIYSSTLNYQHKILICHQFGNFQIYVNTID